MYFHRYQYKSLSLFWINDELKGLLTSNYYSVLCYNSEIWNLPNLNTNLKKKLLSASANAIKICLSQLPPNTSYESIHSLAKRGTPTQMCHYKHAIQLHKLYNSTTMTEDWISLNIQRNFIGRNEKFQIFTISNYKVGQNLMVNRFKPLNNKIEYTWFIESLNSFKIICKKTISALTFSRKLTHDAF